MSEHHERRRAERLAVPAGLSDAALTDHQVRLVNLSAEGACIEHLHPIGGWELCFIELPRALGGIRLQGEVVWSRVAGRTREAAGESRLHFQSGLRFSYLTAEQREALMAALRLLKSASTASSAARNARNEAARRR